ncbi:NADH dehydrogenase [ubiquinone] 1 alpha subcomplex subunit 5 [Strongylocentrotus purpuratus]|uniref:NADH dehydrogenase [ubiquinone] 1 alpha subcomplex subunit 5 n=1 Tax=Strongylocentrotus purpuratus TaxID=7668 RepID=A0A7M7T5X0_STRPU|nr:NADH dehydrogenase [ubiquinone] 1 alpha subcomplex subunit 5 [Strongylocentrotus purpuratus]|eukprot:XP_790510.1 PREDICTED: NADH dehydrogenase [ubiquinone] 1 alpha subcomplex subunit 5 [Strongylocentrotus purpuratus]
MSGAIKKTTGLVGLAVEANPHEKLKILYNKILSAVKQMPKEASYRLYTEQVVNDRLSVVQSEGNAEKVEQKLNAGQIEEVVLQAEAELSLARKMAAWKSWEPLRGDAPPGQWKWP